jgi:endoglucanase
LQLKQSRLAHLDVAVEACIRNGLCTIIDLRVLPGWRNNEWHCDNPTHHAGLWGQAQFEGRVINIWRQVAEPYGGNPWAAGYEPMNEPGDPSGEHVRRYFPRLLKAIRDIDLQLYSVPEG